MDKHSPQPVVSNIYTWTNIEEWMTLRHTQQWGVGNIKVLSNIQAW